MGIQRQSFSESDRNERRHGAANIDLDRGAEVRCTNPNWRGASTLTWTPCDGLHADQAWRKGANRHQSRHLRRRPGNRRGAGSRKGGRPGRKRFGAPYSKLYAAMREQQGHRPRQRELQNRGAPLGAGGSQRKLVWSTETAGNIKTPRNGSRTAIAAGSSTLFSARRLCAISSRRWARLRSVASARTPWLAALP